jgi:hypothetical protein
LFFVGILLVEENCVAFVGEFAVFARNAPNLQPPALGVVFGVA